MGKKPAKGSKKDLKLKKKVIPSFGNSDLGLINTSQYAIIKIASVSNFRKAIGGFVIKDGSLLEPEQSQFVTVDTVGLVVRDNLIVASFDRKFLPPRRDVWSMVGTFNGDLGNEKDDSIIFTDDVESTEFDDI